MEARITTPKWLGFAGNVVVTFVATFAGVLGAQSLSNDAERFRQFEHFNSIFRIMGQDCQRTHTILEDAPADSDLNSAWLGPPRFTWNFAYNDAAILTQVDPERMSRLAEQIRTVDAKYAQFASFADDYHVAFITPETVDDFEPPPPQKKIEEDPDRYSYCTVVGDRCINEKNRDAAKPVMRAKLEKYYKDYVDATAVTCAVFFDLVQKR